MLQCLWSVTVASVGISKTKTKLSVHDFGKGIQVNVHNIEICACLGYYAVSCCNYHTTPRNIPEDRRSHQHRGGSLQSRFMMLCSESMWNLFMLW